MLTWAINTWSESGAQKGKSIQTSGPGDNVVVNESQASRVQAHFYHRHGLEQFLERIS